MYQFNDCGVCTNADRTDLRRMTYYEIAQHNGLYISGYSLYYNDGGCGTPCSIYSKHFGTRKECRDNVLDQMERQAIKERGWYERAAHESYKASIKACNDILACIKKERNKSRQPVQLELFA